MFHPEVEDLVLTDVLFALSDRTRLSIVRELADGLPDRGALLGGRRADAQVDPLAPAQDAA